MNEWTIQKQINGQIQVIMNEYIYINGLMHDNNGHIEINGCYVPVSNYIINMI